MAGLQPGTLLGGDFEILRALGEGGMGAVYVARQLSTGKERALKVMKRELITDDRSRQRFVEEAKVAARIASAHVVEVIAAGVDEATSVPWLAMELLDGHDLEHHLKSEGPMSLETLTALYEQLAHALGEAHRQGIIHRDLKPENLFLAQSNRVGDQPLLKVLDFGIAALVASDKTAATVTSAIGSPLWVAPEQMATGAKLRAATDVWAMGLIGFYLLTGKSYWPAANAEPFNMNALVAEIVAHPLATASARAQELGVGPLPRGFDGWFARCVVRDLDARFEDASAAYRGLLEMTAGFASTEPLDAQAVGPTANDGPTGPRPDPGTLEAAAFGVAQPSRPSPTAPMAPAPTGAPPSAAAHPGSSSWANHPGAPSPTPASRSGCLAVSVGAVILAAVFGAVVLGVVGWQRAETTSPAEDAEHEIAECHRFAGAGNLDRAQAAAERAAVLDPHEPNYSAAQECLERVRLLDEERETWNVGLVHLEMNRHRDAFETFEEVPVDSPFFDPEAHRAALDGAAEAELEAGSAALEEGRADEAREAAEWVLSLNGLTVATEEEARALLDEARAAGAAPPSAPVGADDSEALAAARTCMQRDDRRCAIDALDGHAQSPEGLSMLADLLRQTGRMREAIRPMQTYLAGC